MASNLLVTGKWGEVHVTSAQQRNFNSGVVGDGQYVMGGLTATMPDSNTLHVAPGVACMNGADIEVPAGGADVTVTNGTQGMMRRDLICVRYTREGPSQKEKAELVCVRGTPAATDPQDPEYNDGSILDGSLVVDMPLYRVSLDGITPGEPEPLFDVLMSMSELQGGIAEVRDSVCRSGTLRLSGGWIAADNTIPRWRMLGDVVIVTGHVQSTYQVNPAAEDPVFNLPAPSAEYSYQYTSAGDTYMAGLLSHTGDTEVCLFRSDKSSWPPGSKIMLNGMTFRVEADALDDPEGALAKMWEEAY